MKCSKYKSIKNYLNSVLREIDLLDHSKEGIKQRTRNSAILAVRPITCTVSDSHHPKYPYLLKGMEITRPNQVWSTDITYFKINGGTVYLAAIIDWYSKAVLSWNLSNTMDTDFVMGVLNEALENDPNPEIFNTDQGSQYTSFIHTQTLKERGIKVCVGRAKDNIAIKRLWRSIKCKRIYLNEYGDMHELRADLNHYFNFYSHQRLHQTLNYRRRMEVYDKKKYLEHIQRQHGQPSEFMNRQAA